MEELIMKKYLYLLAAIAFAAVSCNKELETPQEESLPAGQKTITLAVSSGETKSFVQDSDAGTISWAEGDEVGVFTDLDTSSPIRFTMSTYTGSSANFNGTVTDGASEFYVFYPYDENATFDAVNKTVTTSLPATQVIVEHNVAKGAMVAVGTATKNGGSYSVTLNNAFAYLRIKITDENVSSIVIEGTKNIAGNATFSFADASVSGTPGSTTSIVASKSGGYFEKDNDYYIPVLPVNDVTLTFKLTVNNHGIASGTAPNDDWKAERTASAAFNFTRGTGKKFDNFTGGTWDWYFDIHDAASLKRFRALVEAEEFPTNGVAKITSDLDLSGETLTALTKEFKGTLDGQGHSITNWTSNGVALLNNVNGEVKNLTLASSCTLTFATSNPSQRAGFIANAVYNKGTLDGITSNATVQEVTDSFSSGVYAGVLTGVSYGIVKNCVNNSNVSIINTSTSGNFYLGGLVGYFNSGDKDACINNTNNGNVSLRVNVKGNNVFVGGICAGTSISAIASATSSKGTMRNCLNTGNISYYSTNGGSMTENGGTAGSGNYFKVGGLAGYWEGNMYDCTNGVDGDATKGQISVTVPTNETASCATGPAIGGVAAFVLRNMTGCKNYGNVTIEGTFGGGTVTNSGCGVTGEFCAAGVVGQIGPNDNADTYSLSDCHNYGTLNLKGWMAYVNGAGFNFGGVVGYSVVPVSLCTNNGAMTVESKGAFVRAGGVAGYTVSEATSLTNNGNLTVSVVRSTAGEVASYKQLSSELRIGGVVGYAKGEASACDNNNPLTLTTTAADNLAANLQLGGSVGYAGAAFSGSNKGKVTVTYNGKSVRCGGVLGEGVAQGLGSACKNEGDVDVTCPNVGQSWVGGVFGFIAAPSSGTVTHSGLENRGNLSFTVTDSSNSGFYYLSGVSGTSAASQIFSGCKNYGNLTYSGDAKIRIGGINAYMNKTAHDSVVECNITASCTGRDYSEVGGVSAYTAATDLKNWSFKGTINTSGSTKKVYTGGLLGKVAGNAKFNGCSFDGSLTGASGNNTPGLYSGGLQNNGKTITFGDSAKCVVKSGSKVNGSTITALANDNLVSQSSDGTNGFTSTGALTNIVIE